MNPSRCETNAPQITHRSHTKSHTDHTEITHKSHSRGTLRDTRLVLRYSPPPRYQRFSLTQTFHGCCRHEKGCYEEYNVFTCFLVCINRTVERSRSGGQGVPCFRRYGRELVSKPAISFKESRGGYRSKIHKWPDTSAPPLRWSIHFKKTPTHFVFCFFSSSHLLSSRCRLSLALPPSSNSDPRSHIAGPSPPLPTTVHYRYIIFIFVARIIIQHFLSSSTRVEWVDEKLNVDTDPANHPARCNFFSRKAHSKTKFENNQRERKKKTGPTPQCAHDHSASVCFSSRPTLLEAVPCRFISLSRAPVFSSLDMRPTRARIRRGPPLSLKAAVGVHTRTYLSTA